MSEETQQPKEPQVPSATQPEPEVDLGNLFLSYSMGINWTPEEREKRLKEQRELLAKRATDPSAVNPLPQQPGPKAASQPSQHLSDQPAEQLDREP